MDGAREEGGSGGDGGGGGWHLIISWLLRFSHTQCQISGGKLTQFTSVGQGVNDNGEVTVFPPSSWTAASILERETAQEFGIRRVTCGWEVGDNSYDDSMLVIREDRVNWVAQQVQVANFQRHLLNNDLRKKATTILVQGLEISLNRTGQ